MTLEVIEHGGIRYAEIIRATARAEKSVFFSPAGQSLQFGLLAHEAGFIEPAHFHPRIERKINDLQQMFVVQRGIIAIDFFDESHALFRTETVGVGDAVLLIHGVHAIRVIEDMQCVSVKQGPFLGVENDKVNIQVKS
jgi:hypothetical protein